MKIRADQKSKRRRSLLSAALEQFEKKGFEAVGIRDLAKCCKISVGTYYNYFKSKEEILFNIVEDIAVVFRKIHPKFIEMRKNTPLDAVLNAFMLTHLKHFSTAEAVMLKYPNIFNDPRLFRTDKPLDARLLSLKQHADDYRERLWNLIKPLIHEGQVLVTDDPESLWQGMAWNWYNSNLVAWFSDSTKGKQKAKPFIELNTRIFAESLSRHIRCQIP